MKLLMLSICLLKWNFIFSKLKMKSFPLFSTNPIVPNCLEKKKKIKRNKKKRNEFNVQTGRLLRLRF